ncbi:MAG: tetratricopeptide repeat protein, partial [Deltaproteobacteria bacterium]|nr:tetratricopeptide repeat protein [Deltaproteobacteria bacterium]
MTSSTPRAEGARASAPGAWLLGALLSAPWALPARAQDAAPAPRAEQELSEGELSEGALDALIEGGDEEARQRALWVEFKRYAARYIEDAKEQKETSAALFKRLYQAQVDRVEVRYARPIRETSEEERAQRRESVERFKSFLENPAPHPQYTPDSLYRLAMLLLEEEDAEFLERMDVYRERLKTASADEDLPPPQRDHRKVISAFTRLIEGWPDYRDLDSAFYARAHSFLEMGEEQTAMRDFRTIIERFPASEYRTEVWNLIGELHFRFAELPEAIKAYSEVLKDKESQYYAAAFYKLAWTYYRNDQFEEAVESFKRLISYSDELTREGKRPFELRAEAIQYLAISLNEDDWDDDGVADAAAGFARAQRHVTPDLGYQGELLEAMVAIFFETSKYDDAIRTAQLLFKAQPFYRNNPVIHATVVTAYERIAQPDLAFKSRDQLNAAYITDGPWYTA